MLTMNNNNNSNESKSTLPSLTDLCLDMDADNLESFGHLELLPEQLCVGILFRILKRGGDIL